ncbi:glycosyltransferase 4 family protein [Methanococcus maripaludis]|uniref:UDP-N-acetylglucosamine--dolichyl-phosphate N-acetylglucosaminephosphotransferase n=2 Tax=Methanococcus maripaludis TaxID=39152 RepID=A0A7J9PIP1_METMI|nr:glycosyltransferase 4 family protein [Methanococcus maripaludis]MBA2861389.1 UDP-N-acetylglucosamine--dolichyl-phosphate N-acetylglucosaminephosphotransferase [Methanococcus maripaludis]
MDLYFVLSALFSFVISLIFTKFIIKKMANNKYGYDLHKENKIKVAEMGGISPVIITSITMLFFNPALSLSIFLSGFVGIIDDISRLNSKEKIVLTFLIGIPVALLLKLDVLLSVLLILGIFVSSNLTNMLAGFNGLEIGMGILLCLFMALVCLINGDIFGFNVLILFSAAYFGLLCYNKYPAKVFPGDTGTLPIGAFLATVAVWRGYIPEFFILMIPYILDALLKQFTAGVTKKDSVFTPTKLKNGKLYVEGGYLSLPRMILMKKSMEEYKIVLVVWSIESFFGILSILYTKYIGFNIF